jgi:hypothetical protein
LRAFDFKVWKKWDYDQKKIVFQIISIWVSKNAEFDAEFESVEKEKVAKMFTQRNL